MGRRSAVVAAASVLFAIGTAVASALPHDAELGRLTAVGPVTLSSSRPGAAILHADGLKPGQKVAGILSLTNQGDKPGRSRSRSPAAATGPVRTAAGSGTS
jgi:hypothetical protein